MSELFPNPNCERCQRILHDGQAHLLISFTIAELVELAQSTIDPNTRVRLLKAIELLDAETAKGLW